MCRGRWSIYLLIDHFRLMTLMGRLRIGDEVKGGIRAHAQSVEGIHEVCNSYEFHDRPDAEM